MKYLVTLTETYSRGVIIEANSAAEAETKGMDMLNFDKIKLGASDYEGADAIVIEDEITLDEEEIKYYEAF